MAVNGGTSSTFGRQGWVSAGQMSAYLENKHYHAIAISDFDITLLLHSNY